MTLSDQIGGEKQGLLLSLENSGTKKGDVLKTHREMVVDMDQKPYT